jgi:hypothetical protein
MTSNDLLSFPLQVLVQPLKSLGGTRSVWRKVLVSWLLALVFALPQLFIFVQTEETTTRIIARQSAPPSSSLAAAAAADDPQSYTLPPLKVTRTTLECKSVGYTEEWWQRKVYFTFLTTYILVVPTSIMTFCYSRIIRAVWMRAATNGTLPGGGSGSGGEGFSRPVDIDAPRIHFVTTRKQQQMRGGHRGGVGGQRADRGVGGLPARLAVSSKRKVVKMTMSVIVGFVVCWTPYFVVSLIRIYSDYAIRLETALSVSELMALCHSALNPLLYIVYSTRVVRASCQLIRNRHTARRRHHHHHHHRRKGVAVDNPSSASCCCWWCWWRWMRCCRPTGDDISVNGNRRKTGHSCRLMAKKPRHPGIVTPPSTSESEPAIADGEGRENAEGQHGCCCCCCCCCCCGRGGGGEDGCGLQCAVFGDATPVNDDRLQKNDCDGPGMRRRQPERCQQLQQQNKRGQRVLFVSANSSGQRQQLAAAKSANVVVQQPASSSASAANRRAIWTSGGGGGGTGGGGGGLAEGNINNCLRWNATTASTATSMTTGRLRRTAAPLSLPASSASIGIGTELDMLRRTEGGGIGPGVGGDSRTTGSSWSTRCVRSTS